VTVAVADVDGRMTVGRTVSVGVEVGAMGAVKPPSLVSESNAMDDVVMVDAGMRPTMRVNPRRGMDGAVVMMAGGAGGYLPPSVGRSTCCVVV
jgi:hypothetical protein